jgi:outer membrane protein TolC
MANRADQLLVSVKASEYRTQRNKAQSDVELAKSQVQFLLGSEKPLVLQNPSLPSEQRLRDVVGQSRVDSLSLSQAIGARHAEMAQTDLLRTRFAFMPRLNGMARMDWKERDLDALPDPSWTVGVTASWALFQGAKDWGDMHAARARRDMAKVGLQQLKAREQLDAQATQAQLTTSLEKMQTESAAIVQAEEALRILSLQYEQGLVEIGDVLQTQAMLIQQRLSLAATRHTVLTSLAHQSLLKGRDPAFLASLMQ